MKKSGGDTTVLHICTKNHNHMMYGSWYTKWDRQNFLTFWAIFYPFITLMTWKIKILKTWKKFLKILSFYVHQMCIINEDYIIHGSWNIRCNRQFFLSFWAIFCCFTPLTTQKIKILKNWKKAWRYYHFTHVYYKWQSYDVWFMRHGMQQTFFCHFGPCPLILDHAWRYHHFKQKYQK